MKISAALVLFFFLIVSVSASYAADGGATVLIPGRYALAVLTLTEAEQAPSLSKDTILPQMKGWFEKVNVEQFQFVFYDYGKSLGDGVRAFGELRKSKDDVVDFRELTSQEAQYYGKFVENMLGYQTTPKKIHEIYSDNEVVADDDFNGKPVILTANVTQVSKDAFGKPYIKVPVDEHGFSGLHIYIDQKDPFLRKIKKGSQITVRCYPRGFVMQDVMLDGIIIYDGSSALVGGKAVPME